MRLWNQFVAWLSTISGILLVAGALAVLIIGPRAIFQAFALRDWRCLVVECRLEK